MNILFYCNEYPPYKTGGIGTVTKIVAENLTTRGHNIYIIGYYPNNNTLPEYSIINGVHVYRFNLKYRNTSSKQLFFTLLVKLKQSNFIIQKELSYTEDKISELIDKHKINILELTDYYDFNTYSRKPLKFRTFKIPTILRVHGSVSFIAELKHKNIPYAKFNDNMHFQRCNYLNAVSLYSLKYVTEHFDTTHFKKKIVTYNPVEKDFIHPSQPSSSHTILFIGKLTETKGCYSLLKAFNICAQKHPKLCLHLAGSGNITKAQAYISPAFRNRVSFLGFCNREQIKQEIDNCAFACIPSYFENFSMVALEIMGRQRALIFTNRTSGNEVIDDGINGYTVDPDNIDDIANKIDILYENIVLRNNLAENGFNKIKSNFSTDAIAKELEQFYSSIINN